MNQSVSKSALMLLGTIIVSGSVSAGPANLESETAAEAMKELIEAGYIQVDAKTGAIKIQKSVLGILVESGFADEGQHSSLDGHSCDGGGCDPLTPTE